MKRQFSGRPVGRMDRRLQALMVPNAIAVTQDGLPARCIRAVSECAVARPVHSRLDRFLLEFFLRLTERLRRLSSLRKIPVANG
jgi:hypothetical protein